MTLFYLTLGTDTELLRNGRWRLRWYREFLDRPFVKWHGPSSATFVLTGDGGLKNVLPGAWRPFGGLTQKNTVINTIRRTLLDPRNKTIDC